MYYFQKELIENDILKEENGLKYKHMEIMISDDNPGAQDSDLPKSDSITYLYKYVPSLIRINCN